MKKEGVFFDIVLVILLGCSCQDSCYIPVEKGCFYTVMDSLRVTRKDVLLLLSSEDCSICNATREAWSENDALVDKLKCDYRVWQLDVADERNAVILQVLHTLSTPTIVVMDTCMRIKYLHTGFLGGEGLLEVLRSVEMGRVVFPRLHISLYTSYSSRVYDFFEHVLQTALQMNSLETDTVSLSKGLQLVKKSLEVEPYFMNLYLGWRYSLMLGEEDQAIGYKELALKNLEDLDKLLYHDYIVEMEGKVIRGEVRREERLFPDQHIFTREEGDKETEFDMMYQNRYEAPVIISAVETSCGCLSFSWERMPLLPGKTGRIRVKYKPTGEGMVRKKIYVFSNLPDSPHEVELRCTND